MDVFGLLTTFLDATYLKWLWDGFLLTIGISIVAIIASTVLALIITALRESQLKLLVIAYSSVFRNTPLLVQLFFWYFAVGKLLPESWVPWLNTHHEIMLYGVTFVWPSFEFLAGLFGLTLYFAAFIAEDLRSGIQGVADGQKNAGLALGLTHWQALKFIVFPQAIRIVMPALLGQYMNVIKSSSLTMAIGVAELSYQSRQVETASLQAFEAFGVATLLYLVLIAFIEAFNYWYANRSLMITRR